MNVKPISWKIQTAQIREKYFTHENCDPLPGEQKRYCKWTRDAKYHIYRDEHIIKELKTTVKKNVAMTWIGYEKAYDMVLQTWITECLKMLKIS